MSFNNGELFKPRFLKEWQSFMLYDLAVWKNGMAFKKNAFSSTGTPIIKIAELKNGLSNQTKFTNEKFDDIYYLKNNDMLFSWSGSPDTSIDVFRYKLDNGWLNQHIFKVLPADIIYEEYMYYVLKYLKPNFIQIAKNKQTTGLGHITITDLKKIEVKIPKLEEQRKISNILLTLDNKIEVNNKINEKLKKITQAIFKQWFIDFDFPNDEGKPYKSSGGEMVESELGMIPKGWRIVSLEDIFIFKKGKKPKEIKEIKENEEDLKYLTIDVLNRNSNLYTRGDKLVECSDDDTLMVMDGASSGTIYTGMSGVVASTLAKLETKNNIIKPLIYQYLKFRENDIKNNLTGSAIPHADKKYIHLQQVALPIDFKVLERLIKVLDINMKEIKINNEESYKLKDIRDTLLPKLMSGEIRVPL